MLINVDFPAEPRLRWILEKCAHLVDGGTEPVSGLVLPNAEFFPDRFDGSLPAVQRLLNRVVHHAGMSDVVIGLNAGGEAAAGEGCSSGGCGCGVSAPSTGKLKRVTRTGDGYMATILPQETGNPTVLTTLMTQVVAHVFMSEAELYEGLDPREAEPATDLAAVLLGFGVLLCNGAYIYSKGCGGVKVASATRLPVEELCVALAIHCKLHHIDSRVARRDLDPTPRAFFDEARVWADSNAGVVALIQSDPDAIDAGSYALNEGRSWLSRLFGLGRAKGPSVPTDAEIEEMTVRMGAESSGRSKPADEAQARKLAAIRELVDESLDAEQGSQEG